MISRLPQSKGNLTVASSSLALQKSPLHTLPFLKLRLSINNLSLWLASPHTSQRKKKLLDGAVLQNTIPSCYLPSFLPVMEGGCLRGGSHDPFTALLKAIAFMLDMLLVCLYWFRPIIKSLWAFKSKWKEQQTSKVMFPWFSQSMPTSDVYILLFTKLTSLTLFITYTWYM